MKSARRQCEYYSVCVGEQIIVPAIYMRRGELLENKFDQAEHRHEKYRAPGHRVLGGEYRAQTVLHERRGAESQPHVQRVVKVNADVGERRRERHS